MIRNSLRSTTSRCFQALLLLGLTMSAAWAAEPAPHTATAKYEVRFMENMIDHHAMAAQMATTCEAKAVHTELAELCTEIRVAQQQEIETMQSWLLGWYGVSHAPEMTPGAMRRMEKLASLSAAEFEVEFMETMIRHHARAIREGSMCLERAYHTELLDLCENIIVTQAMEIQLMRTWLCDWYGICRKEQEEATA